MKMNRKISLSLSVLALMAVSVQTLSAQTANGTPWTGHDISTYSLSTKFYLADGDTTATDDNTLYLVNVAACKEAGNTRTFFNQGGHWGTEASLFEIGIPLHFLYREEGAGGPRVEVLVSPNTDAAEDNRVGVVRSGKSGYQVTADGQGVFIDRKRGSIENTAYVSTDWVLYKGENAGNQYYLRAVGLSDWNGEGSGYYYLGYGLQSKDVGMRKHVVSMKWFDNRAATTANTYANDKYRWVIVTRQDLIDRFDVTPGNYRDVADASFLLHDQNFSRENGEASSWILAPEEGTNIKVGNKISDRSEGKKTPGDAPTWVVGTDAADTQYTSLAIGDGINYNVMYGQFYNTEVKGGKGDIWQVVQMPERSGFYMVTCQGFYRPGDGSNVQNASLYAVTFDYSGNATYGSKTPLPLWGSIPNRPTNLTESGIKFYENQNNYLTKTLVWANPGDLLMLGITVEDVTTNPTEDWTAFDNMQLKYLGSIFPVFEDFEKTADYDHYGDQDYKTMVLLRTFQVGKWNSFLLPVDLNKDQVLTAFGAGVKLAKLVGLDHEGTNIAFKTVDFVAATSDDIVVEKNKAYLIMPEMAGSMDNEITWPRLISGGAPVVTKGPHYIIPAVSIKKGDISPIPESFTLPGTTKTITLKPNLYYSKEGNLEHGKIEASESNYIYVMNKGALMRYTHPFALKGTRWYLEYSDHPGEGAKVGVSDENGDEPTSINATETVRTDRNGAPKSVYNLKGQKVAEGTSAENLPVGVYVVDGKKVAVY